MEHFNSALRKHRLERGLTIVELAKQVHINRAQIYLMEKGYLKPGVGRLAALNRFFDYDFTPLLEGESSYPVGVDTPRESARTIRARRRLARRKTRYFLLGGAVLSLLVAAAGVICFTVSNTKGDQMFGAAYSAVRTAAIREGMHSKDTITGAETTTYTTDDDGPVVHLTFQRNSNLLNFNTNLVSFEELPERYLYQFGFSMATNSYVGSFTYGVLLEGEFASCRFDLTHEPVTSVRDISIIVDDGKIFNEAFMIEKLNTCLEKALTTFDDAMSDLVEWDVSFRDDFLPAREQGRVTNLGLQASGAVMSLMGLFAFIGFFITYVYAILSNTKPKLEVALFEDVGEHAYRPLPNDPSVSIGIPETLIKVVGLTSLLIAAIMYGYMLLRQFTGGGAPTADTIAWAAVAMSTGIFLLHFLNFEIKSKDRSLIGNLLLFLGFYLALSGAESVILAFAKTWGFSIQDLVLSHLPANIFGIGAAHYLIMLFLFMEPRFVAKGKKWQRIFWHSLSLLPLGFLIASYIIGNYASVVYGAKSNPFLYIWFPNAFLALSSVCVIYLYSIFFLRLYFTHRFGPGKASVYFTGTMFNVIKNLVGAGAILIVGLLDFFLRDSAYFAFWGVGKSYWILVLIPFILFHKHHIGPRSPTVDGIIRALYLILYWFCFAGVIYILVTTII